MGNWLLSNLAQYGVPVLFVAIAAAAVGMPLPVSLLLIAAGSFADHGEMNLAEVIALASLAAVLGDLTGYLLGRWGGRRLTRRLSKRFHAEDRLERADAQARRWGGVGVFLTRWLFTPLGPLVNLSSGAAEYPFHRFLFFDTLGEVLWVVLYVMLGKIFSHRVQALTAFLGNLTWASLALLAVGVIAWKLFSSSRKPLQNRAVVAQ